MSVSEFDVEELVRGMFNLDDEIDIVDFIGEKYEDEVTWNCYCKIISNLLPLIVIGESPLTKKIYRGFGKDGVFFIKQEITK